MNHLDAWESPTPPEVVFLTEADITPTRGLPTLSFVERIGERVVRRGRLERPWFAIIPNAGHIFGTDAEIVDFQSALLRRLDSYISRRWPHLLRRPPFARLSRTKGRGTRERWRKGSASNNNWKTGGLTTGRDFHFDYQSQLFVSLCYRRAEGVRGGMPQLCDLLSFMKSRRIKHRDRVISLDDPSAGTLNTSEQSISLQTGIPAKLRPFVIRMVNLSFSRDKPIVIFSNRLEDGVMHGVSPLTILGDHPRRTFTYRSIGYFLY